MVGVYIRGPFFPPPICVLRNIDQWCETPRSQWSGKSWEIRPTGPLSQEAPLHLTFSRKLCCEQTCAFSFLPFVFSNECIKFLLHSGSVAVLESPWSQDTLWDTVMYWPKFSRRSRRGLGIKCQRDEPCARLRCTLPPCELSPSKGAWKIDMERNNLGAFIRTKSLHWQVMLFSSDCL